MRRLRGFAFATHQLRSGSFSSIYGIYFGLAEGAEKALVADLVRPNNAERRTACTISHSVSRCFLHRF
jgi:threonine synthase